MSRSASTTADSTDPRQTATALTIRRIALTPGEPAGIGPDLCIALARQRQDAQLICVADPDLLADRARQLGVELQLDIWSGHSPAAASQPGRLWVDPVPLATPARPGQLDTGNAAYVLETLRRAATGCRDGKFDALVTAPVHKGVINDAGIPFSGHTEFLAGITGGFPVMMLACPGLRVALATTHLPLRRVPDAITRDRLERVIRILHHDLAGRFGIPEPRILVCGLNPHAGEGRHLGSEEIDIIAPVLVELKDLGMRVEGPFPADTVFTPRHLRQADAVLAMYHDQGLPVLKHMGFGKAVNITLGLPIVRTSVDHGTALELAGTGRADPGSLQAAIEMAGTLAGC